MMDPNYTAQLLVSAGAWSMLGLFARQWLAVLDARRRHGGTEVDNRVR